MFSQARTSWLPFAVIGSIVVTIDLVTKALAVDDPARFSGALIHNPELPSHPVRAAVCIATIGAVALFSILARRRGAGPITFTWVAAGLLVGGVIGNWSAGVIWDEGVPDFIDHGLRMWNLADFAIGIGMLTLPVSLFAYAIRAFVRRPR